jgi:hypothetical protein
MASDASMTGRVCRPVMPVALVAIAMTLALTFATGAVAGSADDCECLYERLAFEIADTNDDGYIDEGEFTRDAAAGFSGLDDDHAGFITIDELDDPDPVAFELIDVDGNGQLSFSEVMTFKLEAFMAADADGDGYLSFDEMYDAAVAQIGGGE